jgi:hypothetical protein
MENNLRRRCYVRERESKRLLGVFNPQIDADFL